jgi:hypothetical protein
MTQLSLRHRMWLLIEPAAKKDAGFSWVNKVLIIAILLGVSVAILSTEPSLGAPVLILLGFLDSTLAIIFAI